MKWLHQIFAMHIVFMKKSHFIWLKEKKPSINKKTNKKKKVKIKIKVKDILKFYVYILSVENLHFSYMVQAHKTLQSIPRDHNKKRE